MYARTTTFKGTPGRPIAGRDHLRAEVLPLLVQDEGCAGLSMLVDEESGQCIVASSWTSEAALAASDEVLGDSGGRTAGIIGGTPEVAVWDVAVMHRVRPAPTGSCCRVTWMRLDRGDFDRGIEIYRAEVLPEVELLDGFCSASLLVNRARGRACSTATYDSRAALDASRDRSWTIRDAGVQESGVEVVDVGEYDLVLAHLRLPELT